MPRDNSIKSVLIIGSGPIVIGQACAFDYAGSQAARSLRDEGIEVKGLLAFFTYGFSDAVDRFAEKECPFFTLTDYPTMLEVACKSQYITDVQKNELDSWSIDPVSWSNKHQSV